MLEGDYALLPLKSSGGQHGMDSPADMPCRGVPGHLGTESSSGRKQQWEKAAGRDHDHEL